MGQTFTLRSPNHAPIVGTNGDDIVQGSRSHPNVVNSRSGSIRLLAGDDTIRSAGKIKIFGAIFLSKGRDTVTGNDLIYLYAADNENGSLHTGPGSDFVEVRNGQLWVGEDSHVNTASGNDRIEANEIVLLGGSISTEKGNDRIQAGAGGIHADLSSVSMGDGNDILTSQGILRIGDSTINLGRGDDIIDARRTGFALSYYGFIQLGPGNDRITGFANTQAPSDPTEPGLIQGGRGIDTLSLPPGRYTITKPQSDTTSYSARNISQITGSNGSLLASGINRLEGINGGESNYGFGTFLVNEDGIGGFIS